MRTINTTRGPVEVPRGEARHINTTAVVEENLQYLDEEPEILAVVSAGDWCALIADEAVPMPVWVVLDDASMYGVVVGVDGCIDLNSDVEKHPYFSGYKKANNRQGETK